MLPGAVVVMLLVLAGVGARSEVLDVAIIDTTGRCCWTR